MAQVIGVPKETFPGEKRVATVPEVVPKLAKLGFEVAVESGAGVGASIADAAYSAAGARIVPDAAGVWSAADIVFKVRAPSREEVAAMREGQVLVSFLWPAQNPELLQALAAK
jgi:NAD(P) transhydrogenase subunit alpha